MDQWLWLLLATPALAAVVEDDLGVAVELQAPPRRLVSLAPSNTELLFALGVGERLVGVTDYCNYPPAARQIERVAGYSSLSLEKIAAVEPDLVVAARGNDIEGIAALRQLGVPVFSLDIQSMEGLLLAVERLGRLIGAQQEAARLQQEWRGRLAQVKARVDSAAWRPKVMWGYWGEPVYTAGSGTLIDDLITLAGGVNVGRQALGAWPQVGLETILSWAPEVMLAASMSEEPQALAKELERLRGLDGWDQVPAVQQGRVYYLDPDWLTRPGPRAFLALEQLADLLHPAEGR